MVVVVDVREKILSFEAKLELRLIDLLALITGSRRVVVAGLGPER